MICKPCASPCRARRPSTFKSSRADDAHKELATRIADLANRDLTAPREYRVLTNPSFEQLGGVGQLPRLASNQRIE